MGWAVTVRERVSVENLTSALTKASSDAAAFRQEAEGLRAQLSALQAENALLRNFAGDRFASLIENAELQRRLLSNAQ